MNPSTAYHDPRASNAAPVALGWSLGLLPALPLLVLLAPRYEAAGAMIAPLSPALALALAATVLLGWRALPAVAVGALLAAAGWPLDLPTPAGWLGATTLLAQAAFGGLLMRRSSRPDDLALDSNAALRRLVASALACALLGALAEAASAALPEVALTRPGLAALVRATADGASVLLLLPLVLAFAAPQWARWQARRRSVALPLALLALLLLAALAGVDERDRQHAQVRFERESDVVVSRTRALLDVPLHAALALEGALRSASAPPTAAQFDALARPWFARAAGLAELGWLEARTGDPAGASLRHRLAAGAGGHGEDRPAADAATPATATALRASLAQALARDEALVSSAVALGPGGTAVVVYQPVLGSGGGTPRQVVFATVRVDRLLQPLLAARGDGLQACLFDADAQAEPHRLHGPAGCETAGLREDGFHRTATLELAGRRWTLQLQQPVRTPGGVWLFALPALGGAALLSVLLLAMTGRVLRVESDARQRGEDLQRDLALLRGLQHRSGQALDGVFDAVQTGLVLLEPDGRIRRANAALAEWLGSTPQALQRQALDDLLHIHEPPLPGGILQLLREAAEPLLHQPLRLRLPDGRRLPVLLTVRVLREPDGRIGQAVCALHDLSDSLRRRQAEQVLGDVLERSRGSTGPTPLDALGPPAAPSAPLPAAARAEQRILCVHRDAAAWAAVEAALAQRPQVRLLGAEDAAQAWQCAADDAPHLVLLDLAPGDDAGLALLQQLSQDARTRAIPVIVLSADPRPERIDAAFGAGARAYLVHPVDARELLAAVDELI